MEMPLYDSPLSVTLANGSKLTSSYTTILPMNVEDTSHHEMITLHLVPLSHHPVILGLDWLRLHNPAVNWIDHTITMQCGACQSSRPAEILYNVATPSVRQYEEKTLLEESNSVSAENSMPGQDNMELSVDLPEVYQDFAVIFSKEEADKLPLQDGASVPYGPVYNLSSVELETLHSYIQENLARGFIQRSESPAGAPVLFVKKKDGSLRLCVDYRGLNSVTIPNRCPLPLISETLDRLRTGVIFTKLDMRGAYNLIRIAKGEEWKTAFRTRYGHFEYKVMPFGLSNAPATFQAFVNDVLREYLDDFVVVYLDDILIFSPSPSQHIIHVPAVLKKLLAAQLSLKLEKCEFSVPQVQFLGFVISKNGISMDPAKICAVVDWPTPQNTRDVQVFLGLANFYRRFIKDF
jgi:hypothetical protein